MFKRMRQALRWSRVVDLYFKREHDKFLQEMEIHSSGYQLTDFERVVVANAQILAGRNEEAKASFTELAVSIDRKEKPFLSLYSRASIADLSGDRPTYEQLKKEAQAHRSARYDRALPL